MHYVLIKDKSDRVKVAVWGDPKVMHRLFGFVEVRAGLGISERVFTGPERLTHAAVYVEMLDAHGIRAAGSPVALQKLTEVRDFSREACLFNVAPVFNEEKLSREMEYAEIRGFIWVNYGDADSAEP